MKLLISASEAQTAPAPFDELAGRIEGVARAVLELARLLDAQADVDGATLSARWRRSVAPQVSAQGLATARRTLREMAAQLDQARAMRAVAAERALRLSGLKPPPWPG